MTKERIMLYFTSIAANELRRRAISEYPAECCGILIGRADGKDKLVKFVYPVRNTAKSGKNTHFCIDPLNILRAEMYAEQKQLEILGFYHSHPDNKAVASAEDIRYMIPGYYYPIISVMNGRSTEIRCFTKTDNSAVREVPFKRRDENADHSLYCRNASHLCE